MGDVTPEFDLIKYSRESMAQMKRVKHDRRKLRKLDIRMIYDILSIFLGTGAKGNQPVVLAILKGLSEDDEFEFHEAAPSIRTFVVEFVSKFLPIPNEATVALERTTHEQGAITVHQRQQGRERTRYRWRYEE